MVSKKGSSEIIEVKRVEIRKAMVRIQGTAPLIMHKWSEKAKKMILDKQNKATKTKGHDIKVPVLDFISSAYWITPEPHGETDEEAEQAFREAVDNGARWGFPVTAIKQATIMAASRNDIDIKTTTGGGKGRCVNDAGGYGPCRRNEQDGGHPAQGTV